MSTYRVGVDIGGTFTDLVYLGSDGTVLARKIASTPDDYSLAVLNGIKETAALKNDDLLKIVKPGKFTRTQTLHIQPDPS